MARILSLLDRNLEHWALLFFYTMLVGTMAVEVVRREVLAYSSVWGEEIVRYSFIYLVWIGAAAAVRDRAHIRIDLLLHSASRMAKSALYLFGDLVMVVLAVFALYWALETVSVSWHFGSVSHGLRVSMVWFLAAVPLGFALMIFRLVQSIVRDVRNLIAGNPPYDGKRLFD